MPRWSRTDFEALCRWSSVAILTEMVILIVIVMLIARIVILGIIEIAVMFIPQFSPACKHSSTISAKDVLGMPQVVDVQPNPKPSTHKPLNP